MKRKRNKAGNLYVIPLLVVAALAWLYGRSQCRTQSSADVFRPLEGNFEYVKTAPGTEETLVAYTGMAMSFNPSLHVPNWVAWELTADEATGAEPRSNNFSRDYDVDGCADPADYRSTGYDRGHMAPAADMKWDPQAMNESFLMTNICPQAKALNTGAWKKLEEKCRQWAVRDSAIVIVCGPVLTDPINEFIGSNNVAVPQRFFKVILAPYANPPRGIGFIMPNSRVEGGMQRAAVSIDEVERVTGHDFFSELPDSIENAIEAECRFNYWSTLR